MAAAPTFFSGPRVYPKRVIGLRDRSIQAGGEPLLGDTNQAELIVGSGTGKLLFTAGWQIPGPAGRNMTLTITTATTLAVSSNGLDVSIAMASGGSTASAIVAAVLAQFPLTTGPTAPFLICALYPGSSGAGTVANLAKTSFVATQRVP